MTPSASATAVLLTRDDLLRADVHRLAAAAGASLEVAHGAAEGLRSWSAAAVVLVGADLVDQVATLRPGRRDDVHVVGHPLLADDVFRHALAVGARDVLELPAADGWLVELLTDAADAADGSDPTGSSTVGVVAGSGGAGATTFACALALVSAAQSSTALLDLDPLGPGVDRVVGLDDAPGSRWDALLGSPGRLGSRSLRSALPHKDGLAVLTWGSPAPLDPGSVREVLSAAQRGHRVVVADLPRGLDEVAAEVVSRCDRVLVVAEQSIAGVASAGKVVTALQGWTSRLGVVARGGRAAVPADMVAEALGLPLVAEVPEQRRLVEQVDLGLGPVRASRSSLRRAAVRALAVLTEQPAGAA